MHNRYFQFISSILFTFLVSAMFSMVVVAQQPKRSLVYELGQSMTDLLMNQKTYEGASPAELEGYRQGIEQQLAKSPVRVTIKPEGLCILELNDTKEELAYLKTALKLKFKNLQTGEYIEAGFFSKDFKKLTFFNAYILDLVE